MSDWQYVRWQIGEGVVVSISYPSSAEVEAILDPYPDEDLLGFANLVLSDDGLQVPEGWEVVDICETGVLFRRPCP